MKIVSIEFRNFASYGNSIQRIDFSDDKSKLWLVRGNNGCGKTTIANVIKFLLYGKVDGVNMGDLPNRINSSLWGKITLVAKGKTLEIERGMSPNIFKVTIDGSEYDRAGKINVQEYLEREFFGMTFNVFKNIIILSINEFKSFLTMNPGDKKNIIDKLFGFYIINDMYTLIKQKKRKVNEEIQYFEKELGIITENITSVNAKLNELQQTSKDKNIEKINALKVKLKSLNGNREKLLAAKKTVTERSVKAESVLSKLTAEHNKINQELERANEDLKLYSTDTCPTCKSDLTTDTHKKLKTDLEDKVLEIPPKIKEVLGKITSHKSEFIKIRDAEHKIISKTSELEAQMRSFAGEIKELAKNNPDDQFAQLESLIRESKVKEQDKHKAKIEKGDESYFLQLVEDVLNEGGVKDLAMKTILPILNANIDSMMKKVHLDFTIKFDSKFDAEVTNLGRAINPKSMSTGERKRADFVIVIALIKLIKMKYPSLNILFLDEIFSSVDGDGRYVIIKILAELVEEIDLNTFVINHSPLPSELFDTELFIDKKHGFSVIEQIEID